MKIYLDTNILSALVGGIDELTEDEGLALQKLAASDHEFMTSPVMLQEMEGASVQQIKGAILFIYKIFGGTKNLNPETYSATGMGDAMFGTVPWGGGETENTVLSLLHQAFEPNDARHIFQALSKKSNYFLTLDEASILGRYRNNHMNMKAFLKNGNLKIVNLIELVEELGI
jgi:predicted nucleic acid-binding protein